MRERENGRYQIIAGERRWRASQKAGLTTIPAYIRTASDEDVLEMGIIENIQRQDLNSIEIALAYQHLIDEYHLTQEKLSERVGKKRATVANYLRLLKLPAPVQVDIQNHQIDTGHARALLALEDPKTQVKLFNEIQHKGYSVRQVEDIIKRLNAGDEVVEVKPKVSSAQLPEELEGLRQQLAEKLGSNVKVSSSSNGGGKVSFPFKDANELRRILSLFQS